MQRITLALLAMCLHANDIRISEVMSNPQGSEYENEFIELYNASNHVIQINGWILSDGNGVDTISHYSGPANILPTSFALIVDPGYNFLAGPYEGILNDSLPVYTISTDASFGSGGLANSGESVTIVNPDASISSTMRWSVSTANGFSWERVSTESVDSLAEWKQSLVVNGTPGIRNSVTPAPINLSLDEVSPEPGNIGFPVHVVLKISNRGQLEVSQFSVIAFWDENQNSSQDSNEWVTTETFQTQVSPQETINIPLELFPLESGIHEVQIWVSTAGDETQGDDSLKFQVKGVFPRNAISITEIMFSPGQDQGGEWVEILNTSSAPVSLQGWTLSDANQTRHLISDGLMFLASNDYLTLCSSSEMPNYFGLEPSEIRVLNSWPTLNSSSDSIRLLDATGYQIASTYYRGSWGQSGKSLERRHPDCFPDAQFNWATTTHPDGGTPSGMNTRHLLPVEIQVVNIDVNIPEPVGPSQACIQMIFQNTGIDTLFSLELESDADIEWWGSLPSFHSDSLVFTSAILWPGISSIPIRILHDDIMLIDTLVQVLLGFPEGLIALNEIHYLPQDDQVEFLEFVNVGSNTLDLKGWGFMDRSGGLGFVDFSLIVQPDSLFILTSDEEIIRDWTPESATVTALSYWPSLNNSSDSIIILDPLGRRMLAHAYESPPAASTGKSLERLALWMPQGLPDSWSICQNLVGISPGWQNSVFVPPNNLVMDGIQLLDSLLRVEVDFAVELSILNQGISLAEGVVVELELCRNDFSIFKLSTTLSAIAPGEVLPWHFTINTAETGWLTLEASVLYEDDISEDNYQTMEVYISGNASSIIVNEIMPLPESGQSEWIEIYNRGRSDINLKGLQISDDSEAGKRISDSSLVLEQKKYLLLSKDAALLPLHGQGSVQEIQDFPTLNNAEDAIHLYDPQGMLMDEMFYGSSNTMIEGRSLERIRPEYSGISSSNWGLCITESGSTPGAKNSLFLDILASELSIRLAPNPFSPNDDGIEDQLTINYELPFESGLMSIWVFDMVGRKIAEPVKSKPVSHKGQFVWDGEASYGGKAVTGIYLMKLIFDNQTGKVLSDIKKVYLLR